MSRPPDSLGSTLTLTEVAEVEPGAVLSGYEVEQEIGRGAMGTVYRARHLVLGHAVAIKVLRPELAVNRRSVRRFQREARIAANLCSEFFVRVHDFVEEEHLAYLVMDYVDGESLGRRISRAGAPGFRAACRYVRDVALGLSEIHQKGIVHRDIKPENILLQSGGRIKITDLGLAAELFEREDLTVPGVMLGTPRYISPEQTRGDPADVRSDIYSLGMTFYFLVFGIPPYADTDSVSELLAKHLYEPLRFPSGPLPAVPEIVIPVVQRMTEKEPDQRFQTADEVATAMDELLAEGEPAEVLPAVRIRQQVRPRRRGLFAILAVVAFALCTLALVFRRMTREPFWAAKIVPGDCVLFLADNNLGVLWDDLATQYDAYRQYEDAYAQVKQQMEDVQDTTEEKFGTRVTSKYSLEGLGVSLESGCALALLSVGPRDPQCALMVGVSDRGAFSQAASLSLWGNEEPGATADVSGVKVYVETELGEEPCFFFLGRKAIICTNGSAAKAIISAVRHPNLALASSPGFLEAISKLPSGSRNVLYVNKNLLMADIIATDRDAIIYSPWLLALSQLVGSAQFLPSSIAANLIWDWNSPEALAEVLAPEPDLFDLLKFAPRDSVFALAISMKTPSELYRSVNRYLEERSPRLKVRLDELIDHAVEETEMARPEELVEALGNQAILVLTDLEERPDRRLFGACAVRDPGVLERELEKLFQYLKGKAEESTREAAADTLHGLAAAEAAFVARCIVDQDGDGVGEYGYFQELAGGVPPRGQEQALFPGEVFSPRFGQTDEQGVVLERGYCFALYLPTASGPAVREFAGTFPEADATHADAQETCWIAYAWPREYGVTGKLGFAINQQGALYVCENADGRYSGPERAPDPGAALVPNGGRENNLDASLPAPGRRASDGQEWVSYSHADRHTQWAGEQLGVTLASEQRDVGGQAVTRWFRVDESGDREELLSYCLLDEALVVTGDVVLMQEVLERKSAGDAGLLSASTVRLAADQRPSALCYVNLSRALMTALASSDEQVRDAAETGGYYIQPFSDLCVTFRAEPEGLFWDVQLQSK